MESYRVFKAYPIHITKLYGKEYDIGTMRIRDYHRVPYMLYRYAFDDIIDAKRQAKKYREFSDRYRRSEKVVIMKDKIKSGIGVGKTVYVIGIRGTK